MSTFSDNLARANERLGIHQAGANELVPIGFRVGDHENEPGKNLGSLTISVGESLSYLIYRLITWA